jgi:hypothetical protein
MNIRWSLLVGIALLTGCSDDDAAPDTHADGGAMRGHADGGPGAHDGDSAVPDASSQNDSGSSEQVDASQSGCAAVQGIFAPSYTPIDGNCGPIANPTSVPFDGGLHGINTIMQHLANGTITTDIVLNGCSLQMTQKVADTMGRLQTEVDAPDLHIESATRITGRISFKRFNATSIQMCQGNYDAVFTKATSALGAAR